MALLDVSRVTETLVNLLEQHIGASPAWPAGATITVTPEPPDELDGDNTLGLYLYHMEEDPHYKNLPPRDNESAGIQHSPMALSLHYQLTAHSDLDGATGTYREQLMMGLAAKALHDFPVLDDTVVIDGTPVMPPAISGDNNRFRVTLNPVPSSEAVSYWTAGSSPLRLAAYYAASVVLLEPEELPTRPGRVLRYGVFTFTSQTPRLTGSASVVSFTAPGDTDPTVLEARPAQVEPRDGALPPGPPQASSTVTFRGSSLSGISTELLLRNARWTEPVAVDPAWGVQAAATADGETITAEAQETAAGEDILPGVYGALARVTVERTLPDGTTRLFRRLSNETPFLIVPRLDPVPAPDLAGVTQISGYVFQHADLSPGDVRVYAGDNQLSEGTAGALNPGEFAITSSTNIEIRLPSGLTPGEQVPVRVIVNGAESAPQWVVAP